jgi:hypothetical protein
MCDVQAADQTLNMKLTYSQKNQFLFSSHLSQQGPLKEHVFYHKAKNKFMNKKLNTYIKVELMQASQNM